MAWVLTTLLLSVFIPGNAFSDSTSDSLSDPVDTLMGHLQPIGNQRPVRRGEIAEFDTLIDGPSFYRDFWVPARPAIFRGVIREIAAMKNWINTTYMNENFGSVVGLVDRRTNWHRGGQESPPRSVMNYSEFQERLAAEQLYWDDKIPGGHRILHDVPIPLPLQCEELTKTFIYFNLMVNSGQVSYVFHRDYADNFFHFIAGKKTWLIANSTFKDSAYMGQNTQSQDMSPVPPESVDLIKYPRMAEIDFHEIELHPGDILYIPRNWPHYVRSSGTPNMAMNIWFGSEFVTDALPKVPVCHRQVKSAEKIFKERDST